MPSDTFPMYASLRLSATGGVLQYQQSIALVVMVSIVGFALFKVLLQYVILPTMWPDFGRSHIKTVSAGLVHTIHLNFAFNHFNV